MDPVWALVALVAAGCSYKAGSYGYMSNGFPGQRVTVGCLDLSVSRLADTGDGAVLQYQFGNRCDRAARVVLPVAPKGRTGDGHEHSLVAYDPDGEIVPREIDGRSFGSETVEYRAESGDPVAEVCIDAAKIVETTPERWLCFGGAPSETAPG
ncbi:MAG TPA: hypothetical protein VGO00_21575, partial [Kofleriaceae bacterium]|nr:hypothetical protein [Kofleriaceae bacterium]